MNWIISVLVLEGILGLSVLFVVITVGEFLWKRFTDMEKL